MLWPINFPLFFIAVFCFWCLEGTQGLPFSCVQHSKMIYHFCPTYTKSSMCTRLFEFHFLSFNKLEGHDRDPEFYFLDVKWYQGFLNFVFGEREGGMPLKVLIVVVVQLIYSLWKKSLFLGISTLFDPRGSSWGVVVFSPLIIIKILSSFSFVEVDAYHGKAYSTQISIL